MLVAETANGSVDAPIHAAMRADELLDQGDLDGKVVWLRILAAVKERLAEEPGRPRSFP